MAGSYSSGPGHLSSYAVQRHRSNYRGAQSELNPTFGETNMVAGGDAPAARQTTEEVDPWKKHEFLDGLYRFYLDKIISFHTFYLPLVGG